MQVYNQVIVRCFELIGHFGNTFVDRNEAIDMGIWLQNRLILALGQIMNLNIAIIGLLFGAANHRRC